MHSRGSSTGYRLAAKGAFAGIVASRREEELEEVGTSFDAKWDWIKMTQQMPDEFQPSVRLVKLMRTLAHAD